MAYDKLNVEASSDSEMVMFAIHALLLFGLGIVCGSTLSMLSLSLSANATKPIVSQCLN